MEGIIPSIVAKLADYTVGPILHHARYLCCFNNFAGILPNAKEKLESTRDSVMQRVTEANNRTEKIEPAVEKWLKDVERVLQEVQTLEGRILEVRRSHFRSQCQYFLAKKIERKIERMTQLNSDSKFEPFSSKTELPGMKYHSFEDFFPFQSTELAYNEILEELRDKSFIMIGLHGMGGSGKTTLVKEVGKKAEELKLFEKVVMVTVSQPLNIGRIQEEIADKLGLPFEEKSEGGRAQRLSKRLSEGKTLLILDDVWEKLSFEAIGIPFNENNKGYGVLLTTRERCVCTSMQCQSIVKLHLLTYEEAWDLFQFYAKITDDSSAALKDVARKIVNKCKGLPIAIVALGSTLREKTLEGWRLALSRLEDCKQLDIPNGLTNPHICLKISYDNLKSQSAKSLLLLCSIFPEDHEIDLEDLFRFGRGLGLIGTSGTLEKSRLEMDGAIDILRDSCLLLHSKIKEKVKMHDLVRDVALQIQSERDKKFLAGAAMDSKILVEGDNINDKNAISLWDWENGQLPDDPLNCPTLEILLLHSRYVGFEVSNACLERFKMLKILAFLRFDYHWRWSLRTYITLSLPQSIESLKNLHTLCLRGFALGDISILESLQALEILDLRGSSFNELPNGIASLKKLKLLDLFHCLIQEKNAYEVIGRCLQLNELYLYTNSYVYLGKECPHYVSFSRLQRYVLIYTNYQWQEPACMLDEHRPTRALCIDGFNASVQSFMSLPIKDFFHKAEYLHLMTLEGGYKNVIPSMDPQGMNQLIFLNLEDCPEIECLFDSSNVDLLQTEDAFSSLVILQLTGLDNLQEVFRYPSSRRSHQSHTSFMLPKLRILSIYGCERLEYIFPVCFAAGLVSLEDLDIRYCDELKQIIKEVEEGSVDYVSSQSKLRTLTIRRCERLEYIFPVCFAAGLVSLEELLIEECRELKQIIKEVEEGSVDYVSSQSHTSFMLPKLRTLTIQRCERLEYIFPVCFAAGLVSLEELEILYSNALKYDILFLSDLQQDSTTATEKELLCLVTTTFNQLSGDQVLSSKLRKLVLSGLGVKGVFQFQIREDGSNRELAAPLNFDLIDAELEDLPELEFIWKGPTNFLSLQMLHRIDVNRCPKLKTIFSPTIVRILPMLNTLSITNCEELEQIFDSGDAQSLYSCSQQVCFPNLDSIKVRKCNKLKYLFHNFVAGHFNNLTDLRIENCSELQKVFAFEREIDDDGQEEIVKDGEKALLHNLHSITLSSLPNFKEIHHGFKLKEDVNHDIRDCPKYSPSLYLHTE